MTYFLQFPSGTVDLDPGEDTDTSSRKVAELLMDEPWVQLRARHAQDHYTQWTVMTRDENGKPKQIICQQFDGSISLLTNGDDTR